MLQIEHIHIADETAQELATRGEPPYALPIERDLLRYYRALRDARAVLRERLSVAEMSLILDTLNGAWVDQNSIAWIHAEVEDAIRLNQLDEKWKVDGPALLAKLRQLDYIHSCALADAAERWWHRVGQGEHGLDPAIALAEEGEA
jgi:hypothetical protein